MLKGLLVAEKLNHVLHVKSCVGFVLPTIRTLASTPDILQCHGAFQSTIVLRTATATLLCADAAVDRRQILHGEGLHPRHVTPS